MILLKQKYLPKQVFEVFYQYFMFCWTQALSSSVLHQVSHRASLLSHTYGAGYVMQTSKSVSVYKSYTIVKVF